MLIAAILLGYALAAAGNVLALRRVRFARLTFLDGIVLGMAYYLTVPLFFILAAGRIGPDFLPVGDFLPYASVTTTAVLIGGIALLSALRLALPAVRPAARHPRYGVAPVVAVLLALYLATTLGFFVRAGIGSGEHWYRAGHALMVENPVFVLVKSVGNFARTAVFGALVPLVLAGGRQRAVALLLGAAVCLVDVFASFNRVTLVYYLLLVLIACRRRLFTALAGLSALLVSGVWLSALFTQFRGWVAVYGYGPAGFASAAERALLSVGTDRKPFVDQMNGVFESINIVAFHYVVENAGRLGVPAGAYLIRPLTLFLPRALVPGRPPAFAAMLGRDMTGSDTLALNSLLIGEPYGNSPSFWPLLLIVVLALYQLVYGWLGRRSAAFGPVGAFVAFAFWRFDSSFAGTCAVFCLVLHPVLLGLGMVARELRRLVRRGRGPAS